MGKILFEKTQHLIEDELASIPEKYQKDFNSTHEGYAVILEEVRELETEVFFGEKAARIDAINNGYQGDEIKAVATKTHREKMKKECVQIAAMCVRFIQELT